MTARSVFTFAMPLSVCVFTISVHAMLARVVCESLMDREREVATIPNSNSIHPGPYVTETYSFTRVNNS